MTTAAMKRMNTHGTTTLAGAASGRGLLLPMPDTTTTTTHSLGGTPVGVVAVGTIAFYPSGGKCTPSRVRYEKRNPEVVLRNEYFRRVCRGFEKATPQSGRRRCSTTTGKLLDVHAMFQALPPIGLHLSADVLEQTNGAALHVTPPQRRVVFCSRCQAL
ncbi:putative N-acetylmuramoyl-L-alanine amidase [Anopheles sinensis]|uniref:Putative N-acetylmuramoyl-L-alanine amidase n=1 Tax=Anopheles sinensis TaxID=74873 RepID=A0A084WA75_ANOSI|nr:putative N-acetylmuramoyl-L-alanine amidase [Anopheles sinensis]